MSTLFLIRHAQGSFGKGNYDKLSETGKKQAEILANYFNSIDMKFNEIYSGTLTRHKETADAYISSSAMKNIPIPEIEYEPRLNEYNAEEVFRVLLPVLLSEKPEMEQYTSRLFTDKRSFQKVFIEIMNMWTSGNYEMQGVQTWNEFTSGVYGFLEDRMKDQSSGKKIAVFTSGGPISVIIMKILSINAGVTMHIMNRIVNSSITRIKYSAYKAMISSFNEFSHLEQAGGKDIITYR